MEVRSDRQRVAGRGKLLNNIGLGRRAGNDGKRERARGLSFVFSLPGIPRELPLFPFPGLRPRNLYGQSTKQASAEERAKTLNL